MKKRILFLVLILVFATILRLFKLGSIPPSLYSDEANQLYNAYSILETGKDEHGQLFPVSFRSFGDWKPPVQTYSMVPFVWLFGPTEIAARLPTMLAGIGTLLFIYLLVYMISTYNRYRYKLALLSAFTLSISPWHILESRAAMLVIIALFFYLAGVYTFISGVRKKSIFLVLSLPLFVLSIYSYYGMRVVVPLTILLLLFVYRKSMASRFRPFGISTIFMILLLLPLVISFLNEPDVVLGRARTVSVLYDQGIKLRQWELTTSDAFKAPLWLTRLFHNNYYLYGKDIARRFFSHLEVDYLFVRGDSANPFQIPGMGILLAVDVFLLPVGVYWLMRNYSGWKLIFGLWTVSIVPAALTFLTPASNRSFNASVPLAFASAAGLYSLRRCWRKSTVFITIAITISLGYFLRQYFLVLPYDHADWWGYKWKETSKLIANVEKDFKNIFFLNENEMAYTYLLVYNKYNPDSFQKNAVRNYVADAVGFEHIDSFDKYIFYNDLKWNDIKSNLFPNSLYIVPLRQTSMDEDSYKNVHYPNGELVLKIFATD